jgi:hypothetical protein
MPYSIQQSWAFATFFPFRYSLIRYFNVAIHYRYSATFQKGAGTLLHMLHVCYSFHQKCSKLDTFTDQGPNILETGIKFKKLVLTVLLGSFKDPNNSQGPQKIYSNSSINVCYARMALLHYIR